MTMKGMDVTTLSWPALCDLLLKTDDVELMRGWLAATVKTGSTYRAMRIHGRMNGVRRAQEIEAIKRMLAEANKERAA